jgi:hypothetical protein
MPDAFTRPVRYSPEERDARVQLEACVRDSLQYDPRWGAGQNAFDALQRRVDAADPGYRR